MFKTLLNLIFKDKKTLEKIYARNKGSNPFGFTFYKSKEFKRPLGWTTPDEISATNLGIILGGMAPATIRNMLGTIDRNSQSLTFTYNHKIILRRIRDSTEQIFNHVELKHTQSVIRALLDNYIKLRYTGTERFVIQFLACIDDYTDFGVLKEEDISEKLKMSGTYLSHFRREKIREEISKHFYLMVSLYISGESNLGFTDSDKFKDFKKKVTSIAYRNLIDNKLIKETHTSKKKFEAICLTLTALTNLRYHIPNIFPKWIRNKQNPYDYYTLAELSAEISPSDSETLLRYQLSHGSASHQLYSIIDVLNIGIKNDEDRCFIAKKSIEGYLKKKEWTTSEFGNIVHPIYEQLVIEYLESKGIRVAHEKSVSGPRGTKPDNIIERNSNFKKYIEALQNVLTIPDAIKLISVDYTYSSDFDLIKKKFVKHYQSEDQLLIIVLTGQKSDRTVQELNRNLQEAVRNDDGSNHLENIRILTSEQYGEFLDLVLNQKSN